MFFVSLMNPDVLKFEERLIWEKSKISQRGGMLKVILIIDIIHKYAVYL